MSSGLEIYSKIYEYISEITKCMSPAEQAENDNQCLLLGAESCLAIAEQVLKERGELVGMEYFTLVKGKI